jgi:hypothetical protein
LEVFGDLNLLFFRDFLLEFVRIVFVSQVFWIICLVMIAFMVAFMVFFMTAFMVVFMAVFIVVFIVVFMAVFMVVFIVFSHRVQMI